MSKKEELKKKIVAVCLTLYPSNIFHVCFVWLLVPVVLFTVILPTILVTRNSFDPVEPNPLNVSPSVFSEARTYQYLTNFSSIGPKPTGSKNNFKTEDFIVKEILNILNHEVTPEKRSKLIIDVVKQPFDPEPTHRRLSVPFDNILVFVSPRPSSVPSQSFISLNKSRVVSDVLTVQPSSTFMISTHYDTVYSSVGGSSNGPSVAMQIELLRNLIHHFSEVDTLHGTVLLMWNDGKEIGQHGIHAFCLETNHSILNSVTRAINMDSIGGPGKPFMFRLWPSRLAAELRSLPYPYANVFGEELQPYITTPNDWTILTKDCKIPGFDFDYNTYGYDHRTMLDTPDKRSKGSIQIIGENFLAMLKIFSTSLALDTSPYHQSQKEEILLDNTLYVYYDFLGIYAFYSVPVSIAIHLLLITFVICTFPCLSFIGDAVDIKLKDIIISKYDLSKNSFIGMEREKSALIEWNRLTMAFLILNIYTVGYWFSFILGIGIPVLLAFMLELLRRQMSWYVRPEFVYFLYGFPCFLGVVIGQFIIYALINFTPLLESMNRVVWKCIFAIRAIKKEKDEEHKVFVDEFEDLNLTYANVDDNMDTSTSFISTKRDSVSANNDRRQVESISKQDINHEFSRERNISFTCFLCAILLISTALGIRSLYVLMWCLVFNIFFVTLVMIVERMIYWIIYIYQIRKSRQGYASMVNKTIEFEILAKDSSELHSDDKSESFISQRNQGTRKRPNKFNPASIASIIFKKHKIHWIFVPLLSSIVPNMICFDLLTKVTTFAIQIFGRVMGTFSMLHPDILISLLVAFFFTIIFLHIASLLHRSGNFSKLILLFLIATLIVFICALGLFPYDKNHPKRLIFYQDSDAKHRLLLNETSNSHVLEPSGNPTSFVQISPTDIIDAEFVIRDYEHIMKRDVRQFRIEGVHIRVYDELPLLPVASIVTSTDIQSNVSHTNYRLAFSIDMNTDTGWLTTLLIRVNPEHKDKYHISNVSFEDDEQKDLIRFIPDYAFRGIVRYGAYMKRGFHHNSFNFTMELMANNFDAPDTTKTKEIAEVMILRHYCDYKLSSFTTELLEAIDYVTLTGTPGCDFLEMQNAISIEVQ